MRPERQAHLETAVPDRATDQATHKPGSPQWIADCHDMLLGWYAAQARRLPWRDDADPYHVLVSEFMLQQTQVDRVLGKYAAFLEQFPTIGSLAHAPIADVIRAWRPLGYNRRAVRLWGIARQVVDGHDGNVPRDVATLLALEGIGAYTDGAIACFAFHEDVAVVDTNIRRVLHRLHDGVATAPMSERAVWRLAEMLLPTGQSSRWNQALMDLGATICTARRPDCPRCPLASRCVSYRHYVEAGSSLLDDYFASHERQGERRREPPFAESSRFYRGKIVATLGTLPPGETLPLHELGKAIKETFAPYETGWLDGLVDGLARDGLVEVTADDQGGERIVSLPGLQKS
jgi:A/G-specific adenine glycosylase